MSGRTAVAHSHSVHGGPLSFMSCTSGRESSPLDEGDTHHAVEFKTETKKKRFHPLRNLRRMFRRKTRHSNVSTDSYNIAPPETTDISIAPLEQRSCSTSKLAEENVIQTLMKTNRLAPGLSLSHDSVFTPDRADSGLSSSDLENSSLSISNFVPPPMEHPLKSHSSCSESSLLSMDSSEAELSPTTVKSDLELGVTSLKLSHSAAKHKMAVKPKRNHGAPRSRRRVVNSKLPLPTTPEVNEEAAGVRGCLSTATDLLDDVPEARTSKPSSPTTEMTHEKTTLAVGEFTSKLASLILESEAVKSARGKDEICSVETAEDSSKTKKAEETCDGKDDDSIEDVSSRKEESFFGRLLLRRSEKKKKSPVAEELPSEDATKSSSPMRNLNRGVNRRQRVDPIEIPSSPLMKKSEVDGMNRMKTSYSMSPPKTTPQNAMISRSSSPPKAVWPEYPFQQKKEERDLSPIALTARETQKIIAGEMESKFKMMLGEERRGETEEVFKVARKHSQEDNRVRKVRTGSVERLEVNLNEVTLKPLESLSSADVLITHEEPHYVNLKNILPALNNYEKVHHGYENVQVIELVKKESYDQKGTPRFEGTKNNGTPEFMKVQLNRVEQTRIEDKSKPTLIERRKSELMMTNDEERRCKSKLPKKQTSFVDRRSAGEKTTEKTDDEPTEVVLRRKTNAGGSDDQPELMKVFARRSLKVRESEEMAEEMRRSRDSDKENESVESPKEERKKMAKSEPDDKRQDVEDESRMDVRKFVLQKYGRADGQQENAAKTRKEQTVLEESKPNKLWEAKPGHDVVSVSCIKEAIAEDGSEETGFKRIQQRKAEWERRVQQAAK